MAVRVYFEQPLLFINHVMDGSCIRCMDNLQRNTGHVRLVTTDNPPTLVLLIHFDFGYIQRALLTKYPNVTNPRPIDLQLLFVSRNLSSEDIQELTTT